MWRVYEIKTTEKSSCEAYQNFQANKLDAKIFPPKQNAFYSHTVSYEFISNLIIKLDL